MLLKPESPPDTTRQSRKKSSTREKRQRLIELIQLSPEESARKASLRYVPDSKPGIRRLRSGKGFRYVMPDGSTLRDAGELRRIQSLAIPPAWKNVWICQHANGHLQATGQDAKGRKQYRYHPAWRAERDATKYARMIAFGHALPGLRARVAEDLAQPGLPKEKVLATIVRLLETTLIRVGNEEYARGNQSFGLTTLRVEHVQVDGATVHFGFRGKSGKRHAIDVKDKRLAHIVKRCRDLPGYELFQYLDENGEANTIDSLDVNEYLHRIAGEEFTAKDFRTWNGTVLAALALLDFGEFSNQTQAKRNINDAITAVSQQLGNTRAICRKCYVHPAVIECYLAGTLAEQVVLGEKHVAREGALKPEEAAVLAFLERLVGAVGNGSLTHA